MNEEVEAGQVECPIDHCVERMPFVQLVFYTRLKCDIIDSGITSGRSVKQILSSLEDLEWLYRMGFGVGINQGMDRVLTALKY